MDNVEETKYTVAETGPRIEEFLETKSLQL